MEILNILLNTTDMDVLSVVEICDLCKFTVQQIFTYMKEALVMHSPSEHACLSTHKQYLLNCIYIMGETEYGEQDKSEISPTIYFHHFMYEAANYRESRCIYKTALDPLSCQLIGPAALLKLLHSMMNTALYSLNRKLLHEMQNKFSIKCRQGIDRTINALYNMLLPVSLKCEYTVTESTKINFIVMTVEKIIMEKQDSSTTNE